MSEPRDVTPAWVEPMPDDLRDALAAKGDPDAIVRTLREAGYDVVPAGTLKRLQLAVLDLVETASGEFGVGLAGMDAVREMRPEIERDLGGEP